MEYQKFIPEGWLETKESFSKNSLMNAFQEGKVLQGIAEECDSKFNLYVNLGDNLKGVIPRNEFEAINVDEYGFCNPSICRNKVNSFVQFKVKDISRLEITIHEGKNRQVRKMCEAVGRKVIALHRSKIGNINVKDLKLGNFRYLTDNEVKQLLK